LKQAWKIIQVMELAEKYTEDLLLDSATKPVYAIRSQPQKTDEACYRCGGNIR